MDQVIIATTLKLYPKALMQRMRTSYDTSKRYNTDLLSSIQFLISSWKELAPSKVANGCADTGFFHTVVRDPDDDQPEDDRIGSDLH
ncbi:hypothetical protein HPB48_014083 [Haemaphysalis longicornis]|uniref:DDE-1 domain-containing protein n=1 Tax=Haemaphysalis longicornis TaxID=44386 RepID=A0A9J6GLL1_HAELO|nr:hypothetical protein HPB48_014083 [Haemaphysalis longicornis]